MSHVFSRSTDALPTAVRGEGAWVVDAEGNRYLDASGGAIVANLGHGDRAVVQAMAEQAERLAYVHATTFTTEVIEAYAEEVASVAPVRDARVYQVSGGSEATESALKLARAYHLARGRPERTRVIARWGSYHGNTLGALDASGREPLRRPYEPWLGRFDHVPAVYEYRCDLPGHPHACGAAHAERLDETIRELGPDTVAAFIAEPIGGATLGAAVPPDDYWPAVREVCDRHGVLLIVDEVMTGFGRTGTWFGLDHWDVRADIVVSGKGAAGGYWPLGLCIASGEVHDAVQGAGGFVHGYTATHHAVGAAVGRAVLRRLREDDLVEASRTKGELLLKELHVALADHPNVGDVRGRGLLIGVELVRDRESMQPFARAERVTERVLAAGMRSGVLVYPNTGFVDGTDGDLILLGPPFTVSDEELAQIVERVTAALSDALP